MNVASRAVLVLAGVAHAAHVAGGDRLLHVAQPRGVRAGAARLLPLLPPLRARQSRTHRARRTTSLSRRELRRRFQVFTICPITPSALSGLGVCLLSLD